MKSWQQNTVVVKCCTETLCLKSEDCQFVRITQINSFKIKPLMNNLFLSIFVQANFKNPRRRQQHRDHVMTGRVAVRVTILTKRFVSFVVLTYFDFIPTWLNWFILSRYFAGPPKLYHSSTVLVFHAFSFHFLERMSVPGPDLTGGRPGAFT